MSSNRRNNKKGGGRRGPKFVKPKKVFTTKRRNNNRNPPRKGGVPLDVMRMIAREEMRAQRRPKKHKTGLIGAPLRKGYEGPVQVNETPWYESLISAGGKALATLAPAIISGLGSYHVDTNSLAARATKGDNGDEIPLMANTKVANVIRHREFIQNVIGSTHDFEITTFNINPGLDETFPWLSVMANSFTSYRVLGMIIEFKSLASQYTTDSYLGFICMASQYNSLDSVFTDKQSMENSEYANSTKPSKSLLHPIECSPAQQVLTQLYIRGGSIPNDADLKFYDLCRFSIATGGCPANGICGELWVSYEIEFYQPKLSKSIAPYINFDEWSSGSCSGAAPFGTGPQVHYSGTMPGSNLDENTYYFPSTTTSGLYVVTFAWIGTAAAISYPTLTTNNLTLVDHFYFPLASSSLYSPAGGVTSITAMTSLCVRVTGSVASISYGVLGTLPTASSVNVVVTQIPDGFERTRNDRLKKQGFIDRTLQNALLEKKSQKLTEQRTDLVSFNNKTRSAREAGKIIKDNLIQRFMKEFNVNYFEADMYLSKCNYYYDEAHDFYKRNALPTEDELDDDDGYDTESEFDKVDYEIFHLVEAEDVIALRDLLSTLGDRIDLTLEEKFILIDMGVLIPELERTNLKDKILMNMSKNLKSKKSELQKVDAEEKKKQRLSNYEKFTLGPEAKVNGFKGDKSPMIVL